MGKIFQTDGDIAVRYVEGTHKGSTTLLKNVRDILSKNTISRDFLIFYLRLKGFLPKVCQIYAE